MFPELEPLLTSPTDRTWILIRDNLGPRLTRAGFANEDICFDQISFEILDEKDLKDSCRHLNDQALRFLYRTLGNREIRLRFFKNFFANSSYFTNQAFADNFNTLAKKAEENRNLTGSFSDLIEDLHTWNLRPTKTSPNSFFILTSLGATIVASEKLFSVFKKDPHRLAEYLNGLYCFQHPVDSVHTLGIFEKDMYSFDPDESLDNVDENFLTFMLEREFHRQIHGDGKRERLRRKVLRRYYGSKKEWPDKICTLGFLMEEEGYHTFPRRDFENFLLLKAGENPDRLTAFGRYRLVWNIVKKLKEAGKYQEVSDAFGRTYASGKNEIERIAGISNENLVRIRRRENLRNPLVSLGLAKTVGYEIEYPYTSFVRELDSAGIPKLLEIIGFKEGYPQSGCKETSPGPFYDPRTAVLVFRRFVDAGIIDLDSYQGMTFHFNVGLKGIWGLDELIRAMHLTGFPCKPKRNFEKTTLAIGPNDNGSGKYFESKAFYVMTREGFEWTMRCASYLSWALGAYQDEGGTPEGRKREWQGRLSKIWKDYKAIISMGLDSAGLSGYLSAELNDLPVVRDVFDEIGKIYPKISTRYKDIRNFQSVISVRIGNKEWKNVVTFAQEATERAVRQVEAIANEVEAECAADIKVIERAQPSQKQGLIDVFIKKYSVAVPDKNSVRLRIAAYNEVKAVFGL